MLFDDIGGAIRICFAFVTPFLRWRRTRWGAEALELTAELPGDEIIPEPKWQYTHGISIAAPPRAVWPWLAQIGQGRGGFYSYQGLENLVGCRIKNLDRIAPELQGLAAGDTVYLHPKMAVPVVMVEEERCLVLGGIREDPNGTGSYGSTWAFFLSAGDDYTRLIARSRFTYTDKISAKMGFGPGLVEPISTVMQIKMLKNIRRLAESTI